jgi:hypothetical protein
MPRRMFLLNIHCNTACELETCGLWKNLCRQNVVIIVIAENDAHGVN